jgi:signal transduction histidine kinase
VAASSRVRVYVITLVTVAVALVALQFISRGFYTANILEDESAQLQNTSAMISSEFSAYSTLKNAGNAGVYNSIKKYSAMENVRYRVVDERYVIVFDSYSSEYGRNIINSYVMNAISTGKSGSSYYSKTGTIEAVVPVYNDEGSIVGALVADSNIGRVMTFESDVQSSIFLSIVTIMVVVAIVLALVYLVAYRPFKRTMETVELIANGDSSLRVTGKGSSELKVFAEYFNTIMEKSNVRDESRQEFVSNVSHELKTPITSIKVLADSLNMQPDAPVELYREFMQDITKEIDRESKIIEDLLSIVRMDKSAGSLNIASVNINELIEMVLKRLTPLAEKKNVEILFESFRPVVAEVDEVKMTQVVSNLVENAIKYNINDGWVHVSLNADYQYLFIRVEDSGIGIPQQSQDMVFDRFYRVDKARSRETGGTGLGLAIVRQIVVLHHGTIKLYSEEGNGTTFTVRIPLNYVG